MSDDTGKGSAWFDFLHYRARVLHEWAAEGKSPEESAETMCMDPTQVRGILDGTRGLAHSEPAQPDAATGAQAVRPVCPHCGEHRLGEGICTAGLPATRPPFVRAAARQRHPLDGADAQALEGALSATERERDAVRAELAGLKERADFMETEMADYEAKIEAMTALADKCRVEMVVAAEAETAAKHEARHHADRCAALVQEVEGLRAALAGIHAAVDGTASCCERIVDIAARALAGAKP